MRNRRDRPWRPGRRCGPGAAAGGPVRGRCPWHTPQEVVVKVRTRSARCATAASCAKVQFHRGIESSGDAERVWPEPPTCPGRLSAATTEPADRQRPAPSPPRPKEPSPPSPTSNRYSTHGTRHYPPWRGTTPSRSLWRPPDRITGAPIPPGSCGGKSRRPWRRRSVPPRLHFGRVRAAPCTSEMPAKELGYDGAAGGSGRALRPDGPQPRCRGPAPVPGQRGRGMRSGPGAAGPAGNPWQ